jgi:transcriptional regulator with GAF, ATPase, and Fis domain
VDVRLLTATDAQLEERIRQGLFKAPLLHRLAGFEIQVPPLRERREDIVLLAQHFLERYGRKFGKTFTGFLPLSLERLKRYAWPGNVRELQNVIERAAILSPGPLLEIRDPVRDTALPALEPSASSAEEVMRAHIQKVLEERAWVIEGAGGAAEILDMKPSTLRYRMKQLGITKPRPPR